MAREIGQAEREAWCRDLVASTYKDPAQTLPMFQEAYDIFEKMGSIEGQSRILNNWACTLLESQEYAPALELAQKSLQLAKDGGLKGDEINVSATIEEILATMGDHEQAQSRLHNASLLFDEYGRDISSDIFSLTWGRYTLSKMIWNAPNRNCSELSKHQRKWKCATNRRVATNTSSRYLKGGASSTRH